MTAGRNAFHPFVLALRASAARTLLAVIFVLLTGAFFRLQVLQHGAYALKSESNRLRPVPLSAPRGLILDRHGAVIAENVPGYSVSLLAESEDSLLAMVERLRPILPLDSLATRRVVERYRDAPYEPTLLVKNAPLPLVAALEERRTELPGLVVQTEPKRAYPDSSAVAHLVGYVGEATEEELAGPDSGRPLGSIVGKEGLEREYEGSLSGADGVRFVEVDALGRVVREEGAAQSLAAVPGQAVHTTIDLGLQRYVASMFPAGRRGAVVAMDPRSGDILALYSAPAYDPNAFVGGVDPAYWRALNTDPRSTSRVAGTWNGAISSPTPADSSASLWAGGPASRPPTSPARLALASTDIIKAWTYSSAAVGGRKTLMSSPPVTGAMCFGRPAPSMAVRCAVRKISETTRLPAQSASRFPRDRKN